MNCIKTFHVTNFKDYSCLFCDIIFEIVIKNQRLIYKT